LAGEKLAGGPLLGELLRGGDSSASPLDLLLDAVASGRSPTKKTKKEKKTYKERAIEVVVSGDWRKYLPASLEAANGLLGEVASAYERLYGVVVDLLVKLDSHGLVGAGSGLFKAILEVGLEMDWVLGLPYYPGSSIKGAVRALVEDLAGEECAEKLLGSREHVSLVDFSDSYPVGCVRDKACLVLIGDVVNPHYFRPGRGIVEAEYEANPVPVVHISIAPGTVFRVVAGVDSQAVKASGGECLGKLAQTLKVPRDPGFVVAALAASALASGFAARSGKGYNVLLPVDEDEVERGGKVSIVSLKISTSNAQKGGGHSKGQGPKGKPPHRPHRGLQRRW